MSKRHTTLLLSLLVWILGAAVAYAQNVNNEVVERILQNGGLVTLTSQRDNRLSITETEDLTLYARTTDPDDPAQWWLIQPLGAGKYALRNFLTGNYVQSVGRNDTPYPTGENNTTTFYIKQSANATGGESLVTISTSNAYSSTSCLHDAANHAVVKWLAGSDGKNTASDWMLTAVENVDASAIKTHFAAFAHQVGPGNRVVKIRNVDTGKQISENSENKLIASDASDEDFSQFWVMEESSTTGQYTLRNVMTNHYFKYTPFNNGYRHFNDQTTASSKSSADSFVFTPYDDPWELSFSISSPTNTAEYYTHANVDTSPSGRQACYIYNIDTQSIRTRWFIIETELNSDDVQKAQEDFNTYKAIDTNKASYTTMMGKYFTDASYSELNSNYQGKSDAELSTAMQNDGLPKYLIDIALKVKNDTWNQEDKMSKHFRVADYKVYSDNLKSPRLMGVGYGFGRLSNPTGIVVKSGDVVSVFCDKNAPANTELKLEVVKDTEAQGTTYALTQGINIFSFSGAATLYIFYQTVGDNNFSIATAPKLANCPDVKIHIEGGRLQGYFDITRNHTDADWAHMREKLLKASDYLSVKTHNFVLCFHNKRTQDACPTEMVRTVKAWDNMAEWENNLMGYNDKHIPGLSSVHRNVYNFFSKDKYMGGSMMTALFGVQTLSGNIAGHMDYRQMESDGVWGPAHENGHLRQNLIYTLGSLESSCNLFSEDVVYHLGRSTQRGAFSTDIFNKYAEKKTWLDYQGNQITRMLYQLYLYFHVAGHDPEFYPKVFDALRESPMIQVQGQEVKGSQEYLHLARTMCKVANADLSDFFRVYGFFNPLSRRQVYENGIFWNIATTQDQINEALTEMQSYSKKLGNIIFIEDRVEPIDATYAGAPVGTKKTGYNPAKAGDFGQYTAYLPDVTPNLPSTYNYSKGANGQITINGTGASGLVGFKVYDEADNLIFLSNFRTFTLPESMRSLNYKIKAAMSNNQDYLLSEGEAAPEPEPETQTLTYRFIIDGKVAHTESHQVIIGAAEYPDFTVQTPYGVSYAKPAGPVAAAGNKDIAVTWNLPFDYTPSIDEAGISWYNLRVNPKGTGNLYYYDPKQSPNVKANKPTETGENYLWAIVGDPFQGFSFYNKAAGTDKALNNDVKCNISAAGLGVKFKLVAGAINGAEYFSIVDPALSSGQMYLNGNNELGRWSKDGGSTFTVTKVEIAEPEPDPEDEITIAAAAFEEALEAAWEFIEEYAESEDPAISSIADALGNDVMDIVYMMPEEEEATVDAYNEATEIINEMLNKAFEDFIRCSLHTIGGLVDFIERIKQGYGKASDVDGYTDQILER